MAEPAPVAEVPSSPNARKRSRSPEAEETEQNGNKRQRITNGNGEAPVEQPEPTPTNGNTESSATAHTTTESTTMGTPAPAPTQPTRKKSVVTDEKQRNKRLFGALLGNLAQSSNNETSRRRSEIEARRKAELKKQDESRVQDEKGRKEEFERWRRGVRGRVEEGEMRVRHRNLRERAGFLRTETEPVLYYKPWELLPEEEERVERQTEEVEEVIAREVEEFEAKRRERKSSNVERVDRDTHDAGNSSTATRNGDHTGDSAMQTDEAEAGATGEAERIPAETIDANGDKNIAPSKLVEVPESDSVASVFNEAGDAAVGIEPGEKEDDKMEDHAADPDEDTVIY